MLSLRAHAIISGGILAAMLLLGWGASALQSAGIPKDPARMETPMKILFFALFVLFAFSMVPTMVKLFVAGQSVIGNADKPLVGFVGRHQAGVTWALWIVWVAGLSVAMPAMMRAGFFSASPQSDSRDRELAEQIARMPVDGTLVAAPGMTVARMLGESSLKINPDVPGKPVYAGGAIFNFRIAGTGIELPRCRYYFIDTYTADPARIRGINVGTSQAKMTRAEVDAADAALRAKLKADGWLAGHEVYRTEEDRALHGGRLRGEAGRVWLKGDVVMAIERRRLDDPVEGEGADAGEWIQFIDLRTRRDYPSIERYEFEAAGT